MKSQTLALTIDVGGSGLKLAVYDVDRHRSVLRSTTPWKADSWSGKDSEFDVESWWATTVDALATLVAVLNRTTVNWSLLGITVGAIRIPFVLVDGQGDVVRPCLSNGDRRATAEVAHLRARYGDRLMYAMTGHWLTPEFGLPKLLWLKGHEPDTLTRTKIVMQLHDWFIYRLCGVTCSEASSAAMSQVLDANAGGWATELLDDLGLSRSWFPEFEAAGTRVGGLRREVSAATGLSLDVPVHVGGGDTQLTALSAGAIGSRPAPVVIAGTTVPVQWAASGDCHPGGDHYPALWSRQLVPNWWAAETNAGAVGSPLQSLRMLHPDLSGPQLDRALDAIGLPTAPGPSTSDELLVTVGNPEFSPESWAGAPTGVIHGRRAEHTAADLYRSALLCSAMAVSDVFAGLAENFGPVSSMVVTGGLAANREWVQLLADVAGLPVTVPDQAVIGGIGGATVMTGQALWAEADAATSEVYRPDASEIDEDMRTGYRQVIGHRENDIASQTGVPTCRS